MAGKPDFSFVEHIQDCSGFERGSHEIVSHIMQRTFRVPEFEQKSLLTDLVVDGGSARGHSLSKFDALAVSIFNGLSALVDGADQVHDLAVKGSEKLIEQPCDMVRLVP